MEDKARKELEELIEEGESYNSLFEIKELEIPENVIWPYDTYIYVLPEDTRDDYNQWLEMCSYWVDLNNHSQFKNINEIIKKLQTDLSIDDNKKLIGKLRAMLKYPQKKRPTMNENKKESQLANVFNINQTQNQSQEQSQSQKLLQEVFLEAIKDDLTGAQVKELRAILDEHKGDIEKAKPKLKDKLLSFGGNILSGIITNIMTNPAVALFM